MPLFNRIGHALKFYKLAMTHARTPFLVKMMPWMALLYVLSPVDLVPDFLPLLGQMDDIGAVIIFIVLSLLFTPREVRKEGREVIDV